MIEWTVLIATRRASVGPVVEPMTTAYGDGRAHALTDPGFAVGSILCAVRSTVALVLGLTLVVACSPSGGGSPALSPSPTTSAGDRAVAVDERGPDRE